MMGVDRLHRVRDRELRRPGARGRGASAVGDLLAAAPARRAPVHRFVYVRAAVCREAAQRGELGPDENDLADDAALLEQLLGSSRLGQGKALRDERPDLPLLKEAE